MATRSGPTQPSERHAWALTLAGRASVCVSAVVAAELPWRPGLALRQSVCGVAGTCVAIHGACDRSAPQGSKLHCGSTSGSHSGKPTDDDVFGKTSTPYGSSPFRSSTSEASQRPVQAPLYYLMSSQASSNVCVEVAGRHDSGPMCGKCSSRRRALDRSF